MRIRIGNPDFGDVSTGLKVESAHRGSHSGPHHPADLIMNNHYPGIQRFFFP
jgi:hypothetical protein